jgi:hypothetical protein
LDRTIEENRKSIHLGKQFPELAALLASGSNLTTLVASGETTLIALHLVMDLKCSNQLRAFEWLLLINLRKTKW